jgi:hypothetical protein
MIIRLLRRAGLVRSPLRRPIDRTERRVRLAVLLVAVTLIPLALAVGRDARQQGLDRAATEAADRTAVTAVLLVDAPLLDNDAQTATRLPVPARWAAPNGTQHTGPVPAWPGAWAGTTETVWVNDTGALVAPPLTTDQAYWRGILSTLMVLVCIVAATVALLAGLHWRFNRRRYALWDSEWRQIGPHWTTEDH